MSHLVWLGTFCIDIGAFTPFLWIFQQRERVYTMLESWIGARLTTTLTRVGGMGADIPDGWTDDLDNFRAHLSEGARRSAIAMLTKNAIWVGRTVGLGAMSADEAVNYGLSGPMLRASGVAYDVRKDFPYLDYETYDFDVPVGTAGDVYDRYLVRMEELRQSVRILEQALKRLPDGPVNVDDHRVILPPKSKATSEMESHDPSLQAGDGRSASADRRVVRRRREPEGREGLLYGIRRHVEAGALAHPSAVVREPLGDSEDGRRPPAVRRDRDQRVDRHRDGRDRPMSDGRDRPMSDARTAPAMRPYAPVFVGARKTELDELLTRYPTKMAALLPALWIVQRERGWVSEEGMAEVAELLELTPAYVKGVVTFYTMYHQHPVAKHFIQVCTTSPCNVCGAEGRRERAAQAHGVRGARASRRPTASTR